MRMPAGRGGMGTGVSIDTIVHFTMDRQLVVRFGVVVFLLPEIGSGNGDIDMDAVCYVTVIR
jgi:hypothetical protein